MPYGVKIKMEMNNCAFLRGICPYHTKSCNKPCDKYAPIGDASKQIFNDWNEGINELKIRLRNKYFGAEVELIQSYEDLLGD